MINIIFGIGFLLVLYFIPAFFLTLLCYCFTLPIKSLLIRKPILIAGLTIAWAPGIMGGGHGVYLGQILLGMVVFMPGNFQAMFALQNVLLISITFLIVSLLVWRSKPGKNK